MEPQLSSGVWAALMVLGTTLIAGCTASQQPTEVTSSAAAPVTEAPAPVAESFAKYDALRAELITALEATMPDISWTVDKPATLAMLKDGRCMLHPKTMKSSADVVEPSTSSLTFTPLATPFWSTTDSLPSTERTQFPGAGWLPAARTPPAPP